MSTALVRPWIVEHGKTAPSSIPNVVSGLATWQQCWLPEHKVVGKSRTDEKWVLSFGSKYGCLLLHLVSQNVTLSRFMVS